MFVRQQYRREYGKGLPHKKPIASETDACKMKSFARLGGLKEAPASIGGEYFTSQIHAEKIGAEKSAPILYFFWEVLQQKNFYGKIIPLNYQIKRRNFYVYSMS